MPGTITVACKLPHGLTLRLHNMVEKAEPVMGGGSRTVKEAIINGEAPVVTLKGYAHEVNKAPDAPIVGGFALTHGVDADFFEEWMKQNAGHPAVKAGLIFAHSKQDAVQSETRNRRELRSGLEPMAQDGDPRAPKKVKKADAKAV